MVSLTPKQKQVYDFIATTIREKGVPPSLPEIASAMGLRSLQTVFNHLKTLERKGYITRRWNHARSIELKVVDGMCPTCGQRVGGAA